MTPPQVCIVALERCKDDPNNAAGWLIENGFKELERMSDELIARSQRECQEREDREMLDAVMREQKELGQYGEDDKGDVEQREGGCQFDTCDMWCDLVLVYVDTVTVVSWLQNC